MNHEATELADWKRTVTKLPLTLRPSVNQQLADWEILFPFEQNRLRVFFNGVDAFRPSEFNSVTAQLREIERKMGVAQWTFSEAANTLENSSQLARSEYYRQWREAVDQVFAAIDARGRDVTRKEKERKRLILLLLPESLPVEEQSAWNGWSAQGQKIAIHGDSRKLWKLLVESRPGLGAVTQQSGAEPTDVWLLDAEAKKERSVAANAIPYASCLSYAALDPFRQEFLARLNTIPKDIHTATQTMNSLRSKDWSRWWPEELAGQHRLRDFVVQLYLSGNGALIFSNAFVQWAASEIFRRARPHVLIARFGMRSKPKPFTSIAVFENQEKVSTVSDIDDPENSAVDAGILARYIWLSAARYVEYEQAACLCLSEHLNAAWMLAPPRSALASTPEAFTPEQLHCVLLNWLAT